MCKKSHTSGTCRTLRRPGSTASFPGWQRCSGRISGRGAGGKRKDFQELELANNLAGTALPLVSTECGPLTWRVVGRTRQGLKSSRHGRQSKRDSSAYIPQCYLSGRRRGRRIQEKGSEWKKDSLASCPSLQPALLSSHTFTAFARSLTSENLFSKQGTDLHLRRLRRPSIPSSSRTIQLRLTSLVWILIGCQILQLNFTSTRNFQPLPMPPPRPAVDEAANLPKQTERFGSRLYPPVSVH